MFIIYVILKEVHENEVIIMKFKFEKKYVEIGIVTFLVIAASLVFYYFLFHHTTLIESISNIFRILSPIVYGFIFAFLITPVLNFIERKIVKVLFVKWHLDIEKKKKLIRGISLILTITFVVAIFYGFFNMVIPRVKESIVNIVSQFDTYISNFEKWLDKFFSNNPNVAENFDDFMDKYAPEISAFINDNILGKIEVLLKSVSLNLIGVVKALWNLIIGFIISIYVLASKETFAGQSKKIVYAIFQKKNANNVVEAGRFINQTFMGFISGKIVDSAIIGCLCFIGTTLIGTPHALLVSVIVGVTNIIPFFGPFLGAIPCILLILIIEPIQALYFIIFILFLQQLDGNVIGPKILGDSTGLSGFWVIFAITLFGGLYGVGGMIIGVPFCAIVYAGVRIVVNNRLEKKNLNTDTINYVTLEKVNDDGSFIKQEEIIENKKISWREFPFIRYFASSKRKKK